MSIGNLDGIKNAENEIRAGLYQPQYDQHPMNSDPYYNLVRITEDTWTIICGHILQIKENPILYFPHSRTHLRKKISRSWNDIVTLAKENNIEKYFGNNADYVFIAGGRALSTLLTTRCTDTDYFSTKEIKPEEIKSSSGKFTITKHVINFDKKNQLIKRLYKIPHEIVHSFDVDCCSVLINRHGEIYGTQRFIYSLVNGYNTVDFNYFSPSYEWRLIKYSNRGFSVYVPGILNSLDNGISDSIWSVADINDMLDGSMLRALLMNAKGFQKLLIASSVTNSDTYDELEGTSRETVYQLSSKQHSDYEEPIDNSNNKVNGKININGMFYILNGNIGYDEIGNISSYAGIFTNIENARKDKDSIREFSPSMSDKLLSIFNSPFRKVNPGEQTTSTFHKIVLDDPNQWFALDKAKLLEESLYTYLYFKRISSPPSLYDEKIRWFGPECVNLFVYHLARLMINNRIYDKFNEFEITQIKVTYGQYIPRSIIFNGKEYLIPNGGTKGIFQTFLDINKDFRIFSENDVELLNSLYIRSTNKTIPIIELRHYPDSDSNSDSNS